jgi:hypothetical protein
MGGFRPPEARVGNSAGTPFRSNCAVMFIPIAGWRTLLGVEPNYDKKTLIRASLPTLQRRLLA